MKKLIFALALVFLSATAGMGQEMDGNGRKGDGARPHRHFSPEEFQKRQKEFITEKARMTGEQANAFFPLFFELQKKKFEIEHNARKEIKMKRKEKPTEEQCRKFVNKMAEVRVEIARLEQVYTGKYLEVIPACKLLEIQHAADQFQRHLMKEMTRNRENKKRQDEKR